MNLRASFSCLAAMLLASACSPVQKGLLLSDSQPVFEIAVRKVKDGQKEAFVAARSSFIAALTAQDGVSNDREFQSFYALPTPDEQEVFIGMTQYATGKTVGKVQSKVLGEFMSFAKTMDLKAYVFVQPLEGGAFDLGKLASRPGQVLELAVRRVKPGQEAAFQAARKEFVTWLGQQPGVAGSWEMKVVGGKDTEGLTVGMSVYESQEAFQAIAAKVQALPEAGKYFATFEPVALQYAASLK